MIITLDTERSSPAEIRRAIKSLVALEDSTEEIRNIIRSMYDVLAAKVNEERRVYRGIVRKGKVEGKEEPRKDGSLAKGGGMFQGVETGY